MTQDEKALKKRNNRRDAQLCRANKEYMTKIICYLRDEDVPDRQVEDIRQDITDMLLDAQERGEKAETVLGEDYRTFCGEILESIRDREAKDQDRKKFGILLMWFPFVGMFCSGAAAGMKILQHTPWSPAEFLYTLLYFAVWTFISAAVYVTAGKKFYMKKSYFEGRRKTIAVLLALFFAAAEAVFWLTGI